MDSQLQFLKEITETVAEFKQELPEAFAAQTAFNNAIYKDGALSTKIKRLMAISIAIQKGCPGCITYQTNLALEAGATKEEVIEAASVATSMGGTSANAWVWIVVQMLKEMGKW